MCYGCWCRSAGKRVENSSEVVYGEATLATSGDGFGIVMPFSFIRSLEEAVKASVMEPVVCSVWVTLPCRRLV